MVSLFLPEAPIQRETQRVLLHSISWQTYQAMLADMGDRCSPRLAYDRGTLEITMPSDVHEFITRLLERIVTALTEELNLKIRSVGSVTLNREDLAQSVELDSGFYIQNANQIRGRKLDLMNDPPPDLVMEVDITSASTQRLEICKQLKVPEVWLCTARSIEIKQLQNEEYISCENSLAFPIISAAVIQGFLEQGKDTDDDNAVIRSLRSWIQEQEKK